jgi:saccharopine dehydrogenase-like NADP-dependent oxidoreductase
MKILVLGGGMMGSEIAKDLVKHGYDTTVADVKMLEIDGVKTVQEDLNNVDPELLKEYDLVVCALPSYLGYKAVQAAIQAGKNCVDVSFSEEDSGVLNDEAVKKGGCVLVDCGVAPGLLHLVVGRAIASGAKMIDAFVGGVATSQKDDYTITWSPEDLLFEYKRDSRIVLDGKVQSVPALSGLELINVDNFGTLEAFYTDGLRGLLDERGITRLTEKTMRWPGHIEKIQSIIDGGSFVKDLYKMFPERKPDVLVLHVRTDIGNTTMITYGGENNEMSAMARTTALSTSVFSQLVASGSFYKSGVMSPECISENEIAYKFILDKMSENGVNFDTKYPFMS